MGYYITLSLQYMRKNLARTLYSLFGILLSFILVFAVMTTGYSYLGYLLATCYDAYGGEYQLRCFAENGREITGEQLERLQEDDAVSGCRIVRLGDEKAIRADQITKETEYFDVYVGLKDTSNLQKSAEELNQRYHFTGSTQMMPISEVELNLNQGDSLERSLINTIIVLLGAFFGIFSIVMLRNTMTLSVVERMRDYGLLRCVGMSKKQLYALLMTEGILLALCAMAGAVGIGFAFLKGIEGMVNAVLKLPVKFVFCLSQRAVVASVLLCFAVVLFSLIEPARQAGNIAPVEALRRNVVLRGIRGKQKDRTGYHRSRFVGKLLGVSGEYAYKNILRSRGRFAYIFCVVLVCQAFLGSIFSFSDSLYATIRQSYYGTDRLYPEGISLVGWDEVKKEELEQMMDDIRQMPGVERIGWYVLFYNNGEGDKHLQEQEKAEHVYHGGYDEEALNELKPYLTEGEIDYQKMVASNGVILSDTYYNPQEYGEDGKVIFERITDYQVGDTITLLKKSSLAKAWGLYQEALEWSCQGKKWKRLKDAYNKGDEGFEERCGRVLRFFRKEGYDCTGIKGSTEYESVQEFLDVIQEYFRRHGGQVTYTVQGIVSENILQDEEQGTEEPAISLLGARESLMQDFLAGDGYRVDFHVGGLAVGIKRKYDDADNSIARYCREHDTEEKPLYCSGNMDDILEMMVALRTVRFVVKIISLFILAICLLQILSTVRAEMFLRRRELWLYRIAGMTPGQERRMVVLENSSAVILATALGILVSWGLSWYIVSYLLDQMGTIQYSYPWIKSTALAGGIVGLSILICLWGSRRGGRE